MLLPWPGNNLYRLWVNLSLTFGLTNPGSTALNGGGWSIGIEMVFYLFFPIIIIFTRQSVAALLALTAFAVPLMVMFVNITLAGHASMLEPDIWAKYTQPVAFFGYFAAGMLLGAIYVAMPALKGTVYSAGLIIAGLIPFFFIKTQTTLGLLTGPTGLILMSATMAIVAGATFLPEPKGATRRFCIWLGTLSYPIYLIHPLAGQLVHWILHNGFARMVSVFVLTIVLSIIVNRLIEKPMRETGRKFASRMAAS
jgi:peptidoglycan/LPS O-acetylase OafA/YrhL